MNFRIRQVPIETIEVGVPYLTLAVQEIKDGEIKMGPCVLEYQNPPNPEWLPFKLVKS